MHGDRCLPAARVAARAHRAHRNRSGYGQAVSRRRARSHCALYGRRRRARGIVHHRLRSCEVRRMMVNMGDDNGRRMFSPLTVKKFTSPNSPPDQPMLRGLGWDIDSPYSANRGELYPDRLLRPHGIHGTSVWIDPASKSYVILMTNVGASQARQESQLRCGSRVATIVAASLGVDAPGVSVVGYNETLEGAGVRRMISPNHEVLTGLDVLEQENFAPLEGQTHRADHQSNRPAIGRAAATSTR